MLYFWLYKEFWAEFLLGDLLSKIAWFLTLSPLLDTTHGAPQHSYFFSNVTIILQQHYTNVSRKRENILVTGWIARGKLSRLSTKLISFYQLSALLKPNFPGFIIAIRADRQNETAVPFLDERSSCAGSKFKNFTHVGKKRKQKPKIALRFSISETDMRVAYRNYWITKITNRKKQREG